MCGVVGIYCEDEDLTPSLTYYSLYSLQHRGQESAGIAVYSNGIKVYKGMGLVTEVFKGDVLSELKGKIAIGHVRYSTTGESRIENAQPILVRSKIGEIAIGHNGNLVNYSQLRGILENEGKVFLTTSDTEVIAQLLSNFLMKYDLQDSLKLLSERILGSYTLTMLINNTLLGYRDPLGFRPLCVGEGDFGFVIASESCALDTLEVYKMRDVKPGEAIIIEDGNVEFVRVKKSKRCARCVFEYIYFARPDSVIDGVNVYKARYNMGRRLARESMVDCDIVSPVPDSGTTCAIGYSAESGIPYIEALIKNRYVGRTFIMPEQRIREHSVKIKMNVIEENVKGKKVTLVDDSIVRGTTSRKIVEMVRRAGAKEVHFRVGSPPIISPCYFGIDMSELIASCGDIEYVRRAISADTLAYLSLNGLIKSVNFNEKDLCLACLTGIYPIELCDNSKYEQNY